MTSRSGRPIRVLLMASSMRGGGSENQIALLARHLDRQRFTPAVYLTHRVGPLLSDLPSDVPVWSPGQIGNFGQPEGWRERLPGGRLRRQARWLSDLIRREAIDVIYDRTFHMTLLAGHPTCVNRARRVSTIVSPPDVALPAVERRWTRFKRHRLVRAYRASAQVIAVSHAAAESAAAFYRLPRERIDVIRNPVDTAAIRRQLSEVQTPRLGRIRTPPSRAGLRESGDFRGAEDASSRRLTLVCVGRMSEEKGQADLLAALAGSIDSWPDSVPRLDVFLIGNGPLRAQLQAIADRTGLMAADEKGHRVEFLGEICPAIGAIAAADGLVLPSRFEGMPNVVLEAFVVGTPVVATRSGGTVELQADSGHPTAFWALPSDPKSLGKALLDFASDPNQRVIRKQNASELVADRHGVSKAVAAISDVLTRVHMSGEA